MVVVDSGPLIYLSRISQVQLLKALFGSVIISRSVYQEIVVKGKALQKPGISTIEQAIEDGWIQVVETTPAEDELVKKLAVQESVEIEDAEVLFLAKKYGDGLVTNDGWLVKVAVSLGVDTYWTTTLVLLAVRKRVLSKAQGRVILRKLVLSGMYLQTDVYEALLGALDSL